MRLVWHAIANVVAWAFVGWMLWWRASFVLWFDREFNSDAPPFGSKRWHWPAVGLAAFGMMIPLLLKFFASPS